MVAHALGLLGMAALAAGEADSALALSRQAFEAARGGVSPYVEAAVPLACRRLSRGARGTRRRRANDGGGDQPRRKLGKPEASASGRSHSPASRSCGAIGRAPGGYSKRASPSTEAWTTHGASRTLSPTSLISRSRQATPRPRAPCSPKPSRSNARAARRDSQTRSRCRRGSPPRTDSRRSPYAYTPAPHCSAKPKGNRRIRARMARPDARHRRPPLLGGRREIRRAVGAWPRSWASSRPSTRRPASRTIQAQARCSSVTCRPLANAHHFLSRARARTRGLTLRVPLPLCGVHGDGAWSRGAPPRTPTSLSRAHARAREG